MTNVEQRINIYHLASQVLAFGVPGDFVELGCNRGETSVILQRIIKQHSPTRRLHLYDSFKGLPETGEMRATREQLTHNFESRALEPPDVHAGWFADTLPAGLPEQISFAYLDGDLYESTLCGLEHVYPKLSPGAICLLDDYLDPRWPGVQRACHEYLQGKPETPTSLYCGRMYHAFFRKA